MTREEMLHIKEERGYSFAQLAEYSGVPQGTVQKVLTGITQHPRKATLDALEKVLLGEESHFAGKAYNYETKGKDSLIVKQPPVSYNVRNNSLKENSLLQDNANTQNTPAQRMPQITKKQGEYTLEDYYALPDDRRVELIDGVIYDMNAPKTIHQSIIGIFHITIKDYFRKNKGNCFVLLSPIDVQLDCDDRTMVEPDLIIVCDRNKVKSFGIYGAPDFILEVLSDSTRKKDMIKKVQKYSDAGVKEYWMIDPKKKKLIIYNFMDEDLIPQIFPLAGEKGLALYQEELKIDLNEIAAEIEMIDQLG